MFPKTNSIIIFCFFFASIQCYDWCLLIAPDGNYRELGITLQWKSLGDTDFELVMYNRVGNEWVLDIIAGKDYSPQNMSVRMVGGTQREGPEQEVIIKFWIYGRLKPGSFGRFAADILLLNTTNGIQMKNNKIFNRKLKIKDQRHQYYPHNYPGYVVMKVFPQRTDADGLFMLFCNKYNSSDCHPFYPNIDGVFPKTTTQVKRSDWPPFVTQMDQNVFETIGGVVYYIFSDSSNRKFSGWLIVFNIEGRPKYCFTAEGKPLSEECKSKDSMKTLFEDCFEPPFQTPPPMPTPTQPIPEGKAWIWILGIIVTLILITGIIAAIIYFCRKRKKSSSGTTLKTSVESSVKTPVPIDWSKKDVSTKTDKSAKVSIDNLRQFKPKTQTSNN